LFKKEIYNKKYAIKNISRQQNKNLESIFRKHLIKICREFLKYIVLYNNILLFISKIVKINKKDNIQTMFCAISSIKHLLNFALTKNKDKFRFC